MHIPIVFVHWKPIEMIIRYYFLSFSIAIAFFFSLAIDWMMVVFFFGDSAFEIFLLHLLLLSFSYSVRRKNAFLEIRSFSIFFSCVCWIFRFSSHTKLFRLSHTFSPDYKKFLCTMTFEGAARRFSFLFGCFFYIYFSAALSLFLFFSLADAVVCVPFNVWFCCIFLQSFCWSLIVLSSFTSVLLF